MNTEPILFCDGAFGIYVPQHFALEVRRDLVTGVDDDDWKVLSAGPDAEFYWETWEAVLDHAKLSDKGVTYFLHQDGDLWLLPEGYRGPLLDNDGDDNGDSLPAYSS